METAIQNKARKTPLYAFHLKASARIVDFAGWEMPLHYGSQINEHHAVRRDAGMFDVSHMAIVDFKGRDARTLLRQLLSADVDRLVPGAGLYCCLLNPEGGVKDDLIAYKLGDDYFRLVVNAGTREKDMTWFHQHAAKLEIQIEERTDLCMLAVQGPSVREKISAIFPEKMQAAISGLQPFFATLTDDWMVARTGYTGEDGFEVMLPANATADFWKTLLAAGVTPCGLGARDTLRLEAGLNLYGSDMDEAITPLESGLAWTVSLDQPERNFIGCDALLALRQQGVLQKRVGLVADHRTVLRNYQIVYTDEPGQGEVTSGSFSPTLGIGIALARVPVTTGASCEVAVRGKKVPVRVIRPPFVRHGKQCF